MWVYVYVYICIYMCIDIYMNVYISYLPAPPQVVTWAKCELCHFSIRPPVDGFFRKYTSLSCSLS